MTLSVLQKLLLPCQGDSPVGENLEYTSPFLEMMQLSERQPEQQYGETIQPEKAPDWIRLSECAASVAQTTRDLRVAVRMVAGLCHTHHWEGLAFGLQLTANWVGEYWDTIYPQLDPDDQFDPTSRLSILSYLVSDELIIDGISRLSLIEHRVSGSISLAEYRNQIHATETSPSKLSRGEIDAIFMSEEIQLLQDRLRIVNDCIDAFDKLDRFLIDKVSIQQWSGRRLRETLEDASNIYQKYLAEKSTLIESTTSVDLNAFETMPATISASPKNSVIGLDIVKDSEETVNVHTVTRNILKVNSRADATAALDSVCAYFESNEPASPVPLLLQRAKRLIPMSFAEILRELAPHEGSNLLQHLVGSEDLKR